MMKAACVRGDRGLCTSLLILLLPFSGVSPGWAQVCEPDALSVQYQYLRRLSLDLQGRVPSAEELDAVTQSGSVDLSMIEKMLDSDEFLEQIREYH